MENKSVDIKSLSRKTLSNQVIDEIISLLTTGQLKPGDRLPSELELMEICNVSRPVIREAMTSLEVLGIVNRKTRNGTFFSDKIGSKPFSMMLALSATDLSSIIETRVALELGLITLAAEKITDEELAKLRDLIEEMKSLPSEDSSEIDKEFHKIIALAANIPLFEAIIDPLQNFHQKVLEQIPLEDRNLAQTLNYHIDIYNALEKRDPVEAYASMYSHLDFVRKKVLKNLKGE
ncbi:FadR/GntR family transcriptional regulator [Metabacillus sediminilitoris]|uniref:FadR family transcriptional regulator n=1 Tax=Metabacillus sediminilitoris TaxID=2567941 RepID=A0A4S4BXP8_9BACI|nr:FadR/GntR family transcriptional regulator [Metabacillus sediminilitoris]QGQ44379.1 FCD domain-containing protein [Metabacillus sediminilitoris]THF80003.1 FadR family transcriptional regulator [Metabacillus sediminilitoris]